MLLRWSLVHTIIIIMRSYITFLFISRSRFIYVVSVWSCDLFLIFIFTKITHIISLTLVSCAFFKIYPTIFQCGWRKRIVVLILQKFSLRVLLSFCLIFCPFQPDVRYISVTYKKGCICICPTITIHASFFRAGKTSLTCNLNAISTEISWY